MGAGEITAIVGCVIAVLGFIGKLIYVVSKLNITITTSTDAINRIQKDFEKRYEHNSETHKRIFEELGGHKDILDDHELRLKLIEKEGD